MMRIPCPWCGARDENEFVCGGTSHLERPALDVSDEGGAPICSFARIPRACIYERWRHAYGCGRWFNVGAQHASRTRFWRSYRDDRPGTPMTRRAGCGAARRGARSHAAHRLRVQRPALPGFAGDTLASALLANGVQLVGRSFKLHRPRGIFSCGVEEPSGAGRRRSRRARARPTCAPPWSRSRGSDREQRQLLAERGLRPRCGQRPVRGAAAGRVLLQDLQVAGLELFEPPSGAWQAWGAPRGARSGPLRRARRRRRRAGRRRRHRRA